MRAIVVWGDLMLPIPLKVGDEIGSKWAMSKKRNLMVLVTDRITC
ncbi:hypothetical protein BH10CYA1_BH10CYA1_29110 [soil metagenome]